MTQTRATTYIQWKGTDVCLDFTCTCGTMGHFDGTFAYRLRCHGCGQVWELPADLKLVQVPDDGERPTVDVEADE